MAPTLIAAMAICQAVRAFLPARTRQAVRCEIVERAERYHREQSCYPHDVCVLSAQQQWKQVGTEEEKQGRQRRGARLAVDDVASETGRSTPTAPARKNRT